MVTTEHTTSWGERIKRGLMGLGLAVVGVAAGLYLIAPRQAMASETYLPRAVAQLPAGAIHLSNPDGSAALLPVRFAETTEARRAGLANVGPQALDTLFLLYAHPRELNRSTYTMNGLRAPLELAVIDASGTVVDVRRAAPGQASVSVTVPHRWVLAAREGLLAQYGVATETAMNPEDIRRKVILAGN